MVTTEEFMVAAEEVEELMEAVDMETMVVVAVVKGWRR